MSLLSFLVPQLGVSDKTEDPKIANAFTAILAWANGKVDSTNIALEGIESSNIAKSTITPDRLAQGLVSVGKSINEHNDEIPNNSTYGKLAHPDEIALTVPTGGALTFVCYRAVIDKQKGTGELERTGSLGAILTLDGTAIYSSAGNTAGGSAENAAIAVGEGVAPIASYLVYSSMGSNTGLVTGAVSGSGDPASKVGTSAQVMAQPIAIWLPAGAHTLGAEYIGVGASGVAYERTLWAAVLGA